MGFVRPFISGLNSPALQAFPFRLPR